MPGRPAAEATAKIRKACELHTLGQLWTGVDGRLVSVRFIRISPPPWRLLFLRAEPEEMTTGLDLFSSCQLIFRIGNTCLVAKVRVYCRLGHLVVCSMPQQVSYRQLREKKRLPVINAHGLRCEFQANAPLGVDLKLTPVVVDISAGGLRLKLTPTKRSTVFHLGQTFAEVVLRSEQQGLEPLLVECSLTISNIAVKEDWEASDESVVPDLVRSTYLGLVFAAMSDASRSSLNRYIAHIEATETPTPHWQGLGLVANRAESAPEDA